MAIPPYPVVTEVDDPVAEEALPYVDKDGVSRVFRMKLGRPVKHWTGPAAEIWYCPVQYEHRERGVVCIRGVGPVTALANAGEFLNRMLDTETSGSALNDPAA